MKITLVGVASCSLVLLSACASTDISPARAHHESGNFAEAAQAIDEIHPYNAEEGFHGCNRAEDNIWLLLEKGKMLTDAGRWDESNIALYEADLIFSNLEDEAKVSLGGIRSGAAALLIDDRQADYVGNSYDKILMPAYVCLNHMMLGEFEKAANAARQLSRYESEAAASREAQAARIAAMEKEAASANEDGSPKYQGLDTSGGGSGYLGSVDSKYQQRNDKGEGEVGSVSELIDGIKADAATMAAWEGSEFKIPFAQLMGALSLAANGDLGEAGSMYVSLESIVGAPLGQQRTAYVVFETGMVPKREDRSISFVYFYQARDKDGNVINVPSLVKLPLVGLGEPFGVSPSLQVAAAGNSVQTRPFCNLSGVVAKEFADAMPEIITRVVIRALIQEAAQIIANQELGGVMVLVGAVAKSLVEPDLRSWESLGAQHQVASIAVPDDGRLTLTIAGGEQMSDPGSGVSTATLDIEVPVGPPVLIYVRSTNQGNFIAHSCALYKVEGTQP